MPGTHVHIGRRRFVQLMGWAGAAAVAHGGPALSAAAQKSKVANRPVPSPSPSPTPTPAPGSEISAEARALGEVAKQRYGVHLSAQDVETVTKDLDGDLKAIQRLRDVKLANADEPDMTFKA